MNISARHFDDTEFEFEAGRSPVASSTKSTAVRRDSTRRKRRSPQQFNGIHRRRKKKIRW